MSYNAWLYGYGNPTMYTDPTGMWSCSGHPDCKSWVVNALNILSTMSETGRELVNFFNQRDHDRKDQLSSSYMRSQECEMSSDLPYGVRIIFGNPFPGPSVGTAIFPYTLQLKNDPLVINSPIPDGYGLQLLGHEISHWAQEAVRFTIQGELLARFVERQLRKDLQSFANVNEYSEITSELTDSYNPFYLPDLLLAKNAMIGAFGAGYTLFPLPTSGRLDENWLAKFHVKIKPPAREIPKPHTPTPPNRPQPEPIPPPQP